MGKKESALKTPDISIVSVGPDYWDGPRHNRHYFCEALSKHVKVLFIAPPFYLVRILREFRKGTLNKSETKKINNNLIYHSPSKLLFTNFRIKWLNRIFKYLRIRKIKSLLEKNNIKNPILLIWHPAFVDMIGLFNERLVVYYVYDNISGYVGGTGVKSEQEISLLRRADIVFTLSHELYNDNKPYTNEIYHLPNAVDFELFSRSRAIDTPIPESFSKIPHPRIGYIGTINEKVDTDLLLFIAETQPSWSIVLIGRDNYTKQNEIKKFERLVAMPNVFRFSYVEHDKVPEYLKGLDVCMMCYVINNWTYYGDPSKMHEYLSSGKPTIAAGLPAIKEFSHVIKIPDSREAWIAAIKDSLQESDEALVAERIKVAMENSYTERAIKALEIFRSKLSKSINF